MSSPQVLNVPSNSGETDASTDSSGIRRDALITAVILVLIVEMPHRMTILGRNTLGILLLCLGLAVALARWRRAELPASAVGAWVMFAGVGISIAGAVSPRFALESALIPMAIIGLLVFFGAGALSRVGVLYGVLVAGVVVAVFTIFNFVSASFLWIDLLSAVDPDASLWDRLPVAPPRVGGVPGLHPNLTAPILYVAMTAGVALTRLPGLTRIVWLSNGVMAVALVATGSRAGLLAAVAGVLAALYLNLRRTKAERARGRRLGLMVGVAVTAALVGIWAAGFRPSFLFRSTLDDRLPVMRVGLDMFADSPVLGNGPGAFAALFPVYGPDVYPGAEARIVWWNNAHNGFVQSLLEYGLIGTALITAGVVLLVGAAISGARSRGGEVRVSTVALLGALLAFGLHSVVESLYTHLAPMAFIAAVGGAALVDLPTKFRMARPLAVGAALIPVFAVPIIVAVTVGAHLSYLDGLEAAANNDLDAAIREFEAAATADPMPVYVQALNFAQVQSGLGLSASSSASELGPFEPPSIPLNLAAAAAPADPTVAAEHLQLVLPRIQGDEVAMVQYGFTQLELGNGEAAIGAFADAVSINPWLSASPFLDLLPDEMGQEIRDAVYQEDPCRVGEQWILNEVATEDQVLELSRDCAPESAARMHAELSLGQADSVAAVAERALLTRPDDLVMRRLAGMAELELGMTVEGRRNLAISARLGDPYSALALELSYPDGTAPVDVVALADARSLGHTPVSISSANGPVYLFGSGTMGAIGHRERLRSPLVAGPWEEAYTSLHAELLKREG